MKAVFGVSIERALAGVVVVAACAGAHAVIMESGELGSQVERRERQLAVLQTLQAQRRPHLEAPTEIASLSGLFPGLELGWQSAVGGGRLTFRGAAAAQEPR